MAPFVYDGGIPVVLVSRRDGAFLTEKDYELSVRVVQMACDQNSDWTQKEAMGSLSDIAYSSAADVAVLARGAWLHFEVCEKGLANSPYRAGTG